MVKDEERKVNKNVHLGSEECNELKKIWMAKRRNYIKFKVYKGDGLPDEICLNCMQEMNRAFLFRKLCEKSDVTLREDMNSFHASLKENTVAIEDTFILPKPDTYEHESANNLKIDISETEKSSLLHEDLETNTSDNLLDHICNSDFDEETSDCKQETKLNILENSNNICNRKIYNCSLCNEDCYGLGPYRRHMVLEHSQIFKCDICGKEFKSRTVLSQHESMHEPTQNNDKKKPFKNKRHIIKKRNLPTTCTICNKTFRFHSNLERHILIHTGEKPFLCNVCGKGFAQLSYLKIHSFIHTGEKPYKCHMCDKSFAAPGTLMTHIRTHTGERPHVCKICGKDFSQSGYLSAHIRTHTGEKPVECKVCHRRFNQSGRLIIHMRIHSGEKPYSCKDCGKSFAVKGTLKKHIRTHTGERPYICSVCGQAFAQSGTLTTHMKIHRPK